MFKRISGGRIRKGLLSEISESKGPELTGIGGLMAWVRPRLFITFSLYNIIISLLDIFTKKNSVKHHEPFWNRELIFLLWSILTIFCCCWKAAYKYSILNNNSNICKWNANNVFIRITYLSHLYSLLYPMSSGPHSGPHSWIYSVLPLQTYEIHR